jgi:hypothetical protein
MEEGWSIVVNYGLVTATTNGTMVSARENVHLFVKNNEL